MNGVATDISLQSEKDFSQQVAFLGLRNFVLAILAYFLVVTGLMHYELHGSIPWLVAQKLVFGVILLGIYHQLGRDKISHRHFHVVGMILLLLCLSSSVFTAIFAKRENFEVYAMLLIMGCALMEISVRWAVFEWSLIWGAWILTSWMMRTPTTLSEAIIQMTGAQMLAVPTLLFRIKLFRHQYQTLKKLAEALTESEQVRASLDDEVERRTGQLKMAYQDLSLSVQERERIARESEQLHDQLLQSQKMESLGRLAGGVAHDFNNLLTVIIGSLALAKVTGATGAELEELIDESSNAAKRAAEVTGHLLAFSRNQVMKMGPVKVQREVEKSIKLIERLLGEDVKLLTDLHCPQAVIEGDTSQLQQVLMNLVVNARDAMPGGGILTVRLKTHGSEVRLSVEDNGQGIPAEFRERIFEPFFTSKPLGAGTGLGLSTVHGIVTMHKGRVEVESQPGKGSVFTVCLPLVKGASLADSVAARPIPTLSGTGRIMLVEDDAQVRNLAFRALQLAGYEVTAFENGDAALEGLESCPKLDLLLTDVVMPGMDGATLANKMRARRRQLPVLFTSGYTDDRLSSFGVHQEGCDFLPKPFTPLELQLAVATTLRRAVEAGTAAAV